MKVQRNPRQPKQISLAISLALLAMTGPAYAQTAPVVPPPLPEKVDRIEVTGSIIRRRISDEQSLPVVILKTEELTARGQTELKDMMLELPQAAGLGTNAGSAGPLLSLRGFGAPRTLVLLNGRRLALEPLRDQYVPLTIMPQIAIDRLEILNDGASSSYGSDAMAGVTNFITKKTYLGGSVYAQTIQPQQTGGGETVRGGVIYGVGDLDKNGWNVYGAIDRSKRSILYHRDRPKLIDGSALNSLGILTAITNGSTTAFPANITNVGANKTTSINPYFSSGCLPGVSQPSGIATNQQCYVNTREDLNPFSQGFDNKNLYVKGTMKLNANHQVTLEINYANVLTKLDESALIKAQYKTAPLYNAVNGAPTLINGVLQYGLAVPMTIPVTSKYYPGNGITPAVVGATGQPLVLNWGVTELGNRGRDDYQDNRRYVITEEGRVADWDYKAGVNVGNSTRNVKLGSGNVAESLFAKGINDGILNPFAPQDATGRDYLKSISMVGIPLRTLYAWNRSADLTASRELMTLDGGPLTIAAGAEFRRDQFRAHGNDAAADVMFQSPFLSNPNPALPPLLPNGTSSTAATQNFNSEAHRNITSLFAEVELPVLKNVSLNVSVRSDKYRDAGEGRYTAQTVNPKFAFRYEPTKGLMFRGSYNTGFRAPSMVELYQNLTEIKTDARFDDPVLCPGGKVQNAGGGFSGGTAIANLPPGVIASDVCKTGTASSLSPNLGYATQLPNNSTLKEEKSRNYTIGIVMEPIPNLTVTIDHWNMNIRGVVSSAPIATILNDPVGFSSLYIRNPDGTLKYVLAIQQNLGGLRADGLDISANYMFPKTSIGTFRTGVDATYIDHWASQIRPGGPWLEQVGEFAPTGTGNFGVDPNFGISGRPQMNYRWKYTATVSWDHGPWAAQLSQRYNSHYRDQNLLTRITPGGGVPRDVAAYQQFNLVTTYTGFKNLKLTFGINNLFNVNPPLTNNATYADGYLLTNADVLGRAFNLKAEYKF